jgi:hypothetical protein
VDDGLDPGRGRNGVHVGAEEEWRAAVRLARIETGEQVPRLIILDVQPEVAKERSDALGHGRLLPRRARNRRELEEERQDILGPGAFHRRDSRRMFAAVRRPGGLDAT